jgi:hypothetical protein
MTGSYYKEGRIWSFQLVWPRHIELSVPIGHVYVLSVLILCLLPLIFDCILELFQQCGIFLFLFWILKLFRLCGILELFFSSFILGSYFWK